MKPKHISLAIVAIVVLSALWFGRAAWRASRQLVTLNVREVALRDVLHQIERQTWKTIEVEENLDASITLRVRNKPISDVLDRIAQQANARWSALHVVYNSEEDLEGLESTLKGNGRFEAAGWEQVAPKVSPTTPFPKGMREPRLDANSTSSGAKAERRMVIRQGSTVLEVGSDNQVDVWAPELLLLRTNLSAGVLEGPERVASADAAAEMARELECQWTTYISFRKSKSGRAFAGRSHRPGVGPGHGGPNDRFATLTPSQRVQRARERLGLSESE